MKNKFFKFLSLFAIAGILFCSCSKDEPTPQQENYNKFKMYYDALFNTTWKVVEDKWYKDGILYSDRLQLELEKFNADELLIHFTSKTAYVDGQQLQGCYDTRCNLMPDAEERFWNIDDAYNRFDSNNTPLPQLLISITGHYQGEDVDVFSQCITITRFNPNRIEMDYTETENDGTKRRWLTVLEKVSDNTPPN